jgi:TorA-specific chaperone
MNGPVQLPMQGFDDIAAEFLDWLAGVLSAPMSVATVTACRSTEGRVLFQAIEEELGAMPGLAAMRRIFDRDERDVHVAARLAGCYVRLFEGPGGPATVSLYESTYSGPARRLHQQAAADMQSILCRCDLAVRPGFGEPADHLSLELALLTTLLRVGDQDAAEALLRRLANWVPRAVVACSSCDTSGFYVGALRVVSHLLMALAANSSIRIRHERSN